MPENHFEVAARLGVSRESWDRIGRFVALLQTWQSRINLVAPSTLPDIWTRHVLDSLQLIPLLPKGMASFADLGSGSGFPAIPLAIATGAHAHMFESNRKKAAFLSEALRHVGAKGTVHGIRLTGVAGEALPAVDVVTARAVAPLTELLRLASPFIVQGAIGYFHKGQDIDAELTQAAKSWRIKLHRHASLTDSRAVILQVEEIARVPP